MSSIVALIPARAGSKRILGKNTKLLAGHPLIAYTIAAAKQSRIFTEIRVCSDDISLLDQLSSDVLFVEREPSKDSEPDIYWVNGVLRSWDEAFSILRPTSPFRTAETIQRAWALFQQSNASSIRAVENVRQHPSKMWVRSGAGINPLLSDVSEPSKQPLHSLPTQTLPEVFVQNASLEMAHRWCVDVFKTISGPKVAPFFTEGYEGYDLNTMDDWEFAEWKIAKGDWVLPHVE